MILSLFKVFYKKKEQPEPKFLPKKSSKIEEIPMYTSGGWS